MPSLAIHHAEYDDIAADYAASKQLPFRVVVEAPTLLPSPAMFAARPFWTFPAATEPTRALLPGAVLPQCWE
jgi:hypothetical protein